MDYGDLSLGKKLEGLILQMIVGWKKNYPDLKGFLGFDCFTIDRIKPYKKEAS